MSLEALAPALKLIEVVAQVAHIQPGRTRFEPVLMKDPGEVVFVEFVIIQFVDIGNAHSPYGYLPMTGISKFVLSIQISFFGMALIWKMQCC